MSTNQIQQIMESMGWSDGSFIPIANDENKQLMKAMQHFLEEKDQKTVAYQKIDQRVDGLRKLHVGAESDIRHNTDLINAHRTQLTDEIHMSKVAENDRTSLGKKLKELNKECIDMQKYDQTTKKEVDKINENMDAMADKMNWMGTALKEWSEAMDRGEEANQLIEKYCKEDEQKANSLEFKRLSVQANINKQRKLLTECFEEERSLENMIHRTAQLYRQAHTERKLLVDRWKEAVETMNFRVTEITFLGKDIEKAHEKTSQKQRELKQLLNFLENQIQNNKEVERHIAELNDISARARQKLLNINEIVSLKSNDYITLKKTVQSVSLQLQQQRGANRQTELNLENKKSQLEQVKIEHLKLKEKYENFRTKNFNAQERLKHMDDMVEAEEKVINGISQENSRLGGVLFRSQQMLTNWKNEYKLQETEHSGILSEISSTKAAIQNQEKELSKQSDAAYNIDLNISNLQGRIEKMGGASNYIDPEIIERLFELEQHFSDSKLKQQLVKVQVLRIEDDMRKLTTSLSQDAAELAQLESKLKDKELCCEGGEKKLKHTTIACQERLVELSIMKMKVHQFETLLQKENNKLYNLEKHTADFELIMNQRMIDIKLQKDLLLMKKKHLNEELAQLKADIGERSLKIAAMITRYENAVERLGYNDDGTIVTANQIKIETAQEKQELLREGNELNDKVINAEKDIKALENTLLLLNFSNEGYKKSLQHIEEDNKEINELNELNQLYSQALQQLKNAKSQLICENREVDELEKKRNQCIETLEDVSKIRLDKNDVLVKIHKEIFEQKSKMERAKNELKHAKKATKAKISNPEYLANFENDLKVRELEECNNLALQKLADMVDGVIGMGPIVSKHLCEKGITIPQSTRAKSQTTTMRTDRTRNSESSSRSSIKSYPESFTSGSSKKTTGTHVPSIVALEFNGDTSRKSSGASRFSKSSKKF